MQILKTMNVRGTEANGCEKPKNLNKFVFKDSIFSDKIQNQEKETTTETSNKEVFNADEYEVEDDPYMASNEDSAQDERINKIKMAANKFNNIKCDCIGSMSNVFNSDTLKMVGMVRRGELEGKILTEKNGALKQVCDKTYPQLVDMAFNTAVKIAGDDSLTDEEKEAKYQELEAQMRSLTKNALAEMGDVTKDVKGLEDNKQVQMPEEN